jgi:PQQ-dependent catabolism-associated beta-propeller protein
VRRGRLLLALAAWFAAAPCGAGEVLYVSNERAGTLSVIDADSLRVVDTIAVGGRPRGIQAAPDGAQVYVAISRPRDGSQPGLQEGVLAVDTATRRPGKLFAVGTDPEAFAIGAAPPRLYAANEDAGTASITDLASGAVRATLLVGLEPEGVALSPDGRFVYVTAETSNTVSAIDTATEQVVASFLVDTRPRAAAFTRDARFAFVSSEVGRALSAVDARRHAVIGRFRFPEPLQRPVGVAVSPDGTRVYVATGRADSVAVFDVSKPEQLRMVSEVPVGKRPWGVALGDAGARLYTANGASNDVSVIDTATGRVRATIAVGDGPWGIAVAPAPRHAAR